MPSSMSANGGTGAVSLAGLAQIQKPSLIGAYPDTVIPSGPSMLEASMSSKGSFHAPTVEPFQAAPKASLLGADERSVR